MRHRDILDVIAERDAAPARRRTRRVKRWQVLGTESHRNRLYDIHTARRIAARYNRLYRCPDRAYLSWMMVTL